MEMLFVVLLVLSSIALIVSVVMHSGKSAGLSGAIGGGAEQLFGKQKATGMDRLFDKITLASAVIFILSSLILAIIQN